MAEVRETLRPYHIDLRRVLSFDAQDSVWVLCNSLGDAIAQMASTYSPEEVRCFKKLVPPPARALTPRTDCLYRPILPLPGVDARCAAAHWRAAEQAAVRGAD